MIIQDYLYCYDYNYSLDIKEIIVKGFYDALFRDKYLIFNNLKNCVQLCAVCAAKNVFMCAKNFQTN